MDRKDRLHRREFCNLSPFSPVKIGVFKLISLAGGRREFG